MKKIILSVLVLISIAASSQDSVKITIGVQARDLEYISAGIYNDNTVEELWDSLKLAFRVPVAPTGNTVVSVTAYTMDWIDILRRLRNDPLALKLNHAQRVDDLLRAVGQTYLSNVINDMDAADIAASNRVRTFGRNKAKRSTL